MFFYLLLSFSDSWHGIGGQKQKQTLEESAKEEMREIRTSAFRCDSQYISFIEAASSESLRRRSESQSARGGIKTDDPFGQTSLL